ncbi:hypothetical protein ACFL35_14210 [Candidatus Riflebacteria bacterium]
MSRVFILLFLFLIISVLPVDAIKSKPSDSSSDYKSSGSASGSASSAESMEDIRLRAEVQQVVDEFIDNLADSIKEKAKEFARKEVAFSLYFVKHYMEKKKALKDAIKKTADFVVQTTISEFEKLERSNPEKLSEVSSEAEKAKENAKKKKADAKEKKETANKKTTTVIQEGGAKQVDASGRVLKEIVTEDGQQVAYEYEYDENGKETGKKKVDASQYMTDGKYHFRSDEMVKETKGEVFKPESEGGEATGTASGESGAESSGDSSDSSGDASGAGSSADSAASGGSAGANAALGLKPYSELSMGEKVNRAEAEAVIVELGGWADADAGIAGGAAGGAGDSGGSGTGTGGGEGGTGGDTGTEDGDTGTGGESEPGTSSTEGREKTESVPEPSGDEEAAEVSKDEVEKWKKEVDHIISTIDEKLKLDLKNRENAWSLEKSILWGEKQLNKLRNKYGGKIPAGPMHEDAYRLYQKLKSARKELEKHLPENPQVSYKRLLDAAKRAKSGAGRDCYNTSVRTARFNGAKGDGRTWPTNKGYQGMGLKEGLTKAISNGDLKPGMVIYINNKPGADPDSMNMGYQPHWFTYLGKDENGVPRFSDQYAYDYDLSGPRGIVATYGNNRLMDEILDPYANSR